MRTSILLCVVVYSKCSRKKLQQQNRLREGVGGERGGRGEGGRERKRRGREEGREKEREKFVTKPALDRGG